MERVSAFDKPMALNNITVT